MGLLNLYLTPPKPGQNVLTKLEMLKMDGR